VLAGQVHPYHGLPGLNPNPVYLATELFKGRNGPVLGLVCGHRLRLRDQQQGRHWPHPKASHGCFLSSSLRVFEIRDKRGLRLTPPPNASDQLPGRLQRGCVSKSRDAGPVNFIGWLAAAPSAV